AELAGGYQDTLVSAHGHQLPQHAGCRGRTHGDDHDLAAGGILQLQGSLHGVHVIGVGDGLHGGTVQGAIRVHRHLAGGIGDLLDANNDLHNSFFLLLQADIAGDDHTLDFAGALIDLGDLGVAHHALQGIVLGVAVAAEHLQRLGGGQHGVLRAEQLGHGRLLGEALALALQHGGLIGQQAARLGAHRHVGEGELGVLELADGLAELDTALGVGHGLFHGALGNAQSLGRDADAAAVQGLHGDLEALALLAQQVLLGNDAVGEHDLGGGGAVQAHLLFVLAHGEAGEAALHDEGGDAAGALGLVGHGEDHEHVGHVAVGDEDLGAVEDIVVAVQLGLGLALGGVGTGVGFGQAEGADLVALGQHGQVLGLLGLGAV
ncbi:Spermidine/putrescine-binding periplasmic protein, partial [Dysosmobacter welbionis]